METVHGHVHCQRSLRTAHDILRRGYPHDSWYVLTVVSLLPVMITDELSPHTVHALYSCNRGVGRILTSIFLVGTLCEIVGSALMIRSTQPLHDLSSLHQLSATGEVCGTTKMRAGPMLVFASVRFSG